jgi:hypothetical protein
VSLLLLYLVSSFCLQFVWLCITTCKIIIVVLFCLFSVYIYIYIYIFNIESTFIIGLPFGSYWLWFVDFQLWKNWKKASYGVKGLVSILELKALICVKHEGWEDIFCATDQFLHIKKCLKITTRDTES